MRRKIGHPDRGCDRLEQAAFIVHTHVGQPAVEGFEPGDSVGRGRGRHDEDELLATAIGRPIRVM